MAERKATNKYIPADFDYRKHRSVNAYHGSHHLRDRARKLGQGIMIIRFEMPFNVWCLHCDKHIGMGVRFNAEKKRVDEYLTTPILEFKMRCHLCSGDLVMRTDPKNATYECVSGLRKKMEDWEPGAETGQIRLETDEERQKLAEDPFYRLEYQQDDANRAKDDAPAIQELIALNERDWKDPFTNSQILRKKFRDDKKVQQQHDRQSEAIQNRHGIGVAILPETDEDRVKAKVVRYQSDPVALEAQRKRLAAEMSSVFDPKGTAILSSSRVQLLATELKRRKIEEQLAPAKSNGTVMVRKKSTTAVAPSAPALPLVNYSDESD